MLKLLLAFAILPSSNLSKCDDSARPLRDLALNYERWGPVSEKADINAFNRFWMYLKSGETKDYRKAVSQVSGRPNRSLRDREFILGILAASGPDLNFSNLGGYRYGAIAVNSNAGHDAIKYLLDAVQTDSANSLAAVGLARIALSSTDEGLLKRVAVAVDKVDRNSDDVSVTLARYDLLVRTSEYAAGRAYVEGAQLPNCTSVAHAQAESRILTGDTAGGVRLYLKGLETSSGTGLDRYIDDIRAMATKGQFAALMSTAPSDRAAWIRQFWQHEADIDGRSTETRVAEQITRSAFANAHYRAHYFPVSGDKIPGWISDTAHFVPWDARGVIFVRHGAPSHRYYAQTNPYEYEGWVYVGSDEKVIVFYHDMRSTTGGVVCAAIGCVERPDHGDWAVSATAACFPSIAFLGTSPPMQDVLNRSASGARLDKRELYMILGQYDSRYVNVLRECGFVSMGGHSLSLDELQTRMLRESKTLLTSFVWSKSAARPYNEPFRLTAQAFMFRGSDGSEALTVMAWIPAADLRSSRLNRQLQATFVISDSINMSARTDASFNLGSVPESGALVLSGIVYPPPISTGQLSVIVTDSRDSTSGGAYSHAVSLRRIDPRFGISDIVLCDTTQGGPLRRGRMRLSPLPRREIAPGYNFVLYFEIYGAPEGTNLTTSVQFARAKASSKIQDAPPKKSQSRNMTFALQAHPDADGASAQRLEIGGELSEGRYIVTVRVASKFGVTERQTYIDVVKSKAS